MHREFAATQRESAGTHIIYNEVALAFAEKGAPPLSASITKQYLSLEELADGRSLYDVGREELICRCILTQGYLHI